MCAEGWMCDYLNAAADAIVYTLPMQLIVSAAGFYRLTDPILYEFYKLFNWFLPKLNNEIEHFESQQYKSNLMGLNRLLLIMFKHDYMVVPYQSSQFGEMKANGQIVSMFETDWFLKDKLGLKSMVDSGKVSFATIESTHLDYSWMHAIFYLNYLLSEHLSPYPFGYVLT